jgi:PEGA domain
MESRAVKAASRIAIAVISGGFTLLQLAGCATIIHGTKQEVGISSTPTGAAVMIDNKDVGVTPVIRKLSRKDNHVVRIQMAGYQPFETTLTHSVSGWVWGNVAFGGLIGLAVDAASGGIYKLTPEQVEGALQSGHASATKTADGIYVVAVLTPQPDWTRVAQLQHQ